MFPMPIKPLELNWIDSERKAKCMIYTCVKLLFMSKLQPVSLSGISPYEQHNTQSGHCYNSGQSKYVSVWLRGKCVQTGLSELSFGILCKSQIVASTCSQMTKYASSRVLGGNVMNIFFHNFIIKKILF